MNVIRKKYKCKTIYKEGIIPIKTANALYDAIKTKNTWHDGEMPNY